MVQKVLETCNDAQRELLLGRIRVHLHTLKKFTYGKHIVARVEKLLAAGGERGSSGVWGQEEFTSTPCTSMNGFMIHDSLRLHAYHDSLVFRLTCNLTGKLFGHACGNRSCNLPVGKSGVSLFPPMPHAFDTVSLAYIEFP